MLRAWAAVLFAAAAAALPERAEEVGADVYRRACAECHANSAPIARRFANLAPEARRERWEAFLRRHHGGDADQRAALIRYFESAAPAR